MTVRARGPGRVNLIGEHTDYNGGLALPFAIDRGVTVSAEPIAGERVQARAADLGESDEFDLRAPAPATGWRAFVRGTVAELAAAGHALVPCRLTIEGDLDQGSGLSSSAAVGTALALALLAVADADEPPDRRDLARLCSRVENDWVGAETGLLDQLAALFGEPGHAVRIDFATLALERVPLELGDWQLVTLGSGASHSHAASGYNDRRRECREACAALGVGSLSEARAEDVERLPDPLRRRARHVLSENARVDAMVGALRRRRPRRGRPAARRVAREPARRLRGVGARGRADGRGAEGGGRRGRADGRRRLRRLRAGAAPARRRGARGRASRRRGARCPAALSRAAR